MDDIEVLRIIERKSSIPQDNESFNMISTAYDRAAEIIRRHIKNTTGETGFYLMKEPEEALESVTLEPNGPFENMNVYLHGICGCFAIALHDLFKYQITYFVDSEDEPKPTNLIHAYCQNNGMLIDVRGATKDETACFSAFEDFFTDPVIIETTRQELYKQITTEMGTETAEKYIDLAKKFIQAHEDVYNTSRKE